MNKASRAAGIINLQASPFQFRASLFHCTPASEKRRRTNWESVSSFRSSPRKGNDFSRRFRKRVLLHNVSEFAEHLFQNNSWQSDWDEYGQPSSRGSSWFRPFFKDDRLKRGKSRNGGSQTSRRDFEFCNGGDDVEFETIFRSAFGESRYFYWSFTSDHESHFSNSSGYSGKHRSSGHWKRWVDEEDDSASDSENSFADVSSERRALGLSASGPLKIEDVKNAYRASALKWHPDRHQGSSKIVAEEKFKICSAAYQSLCDKLTLH